MIDLRSDTVTKPSIGMIKAMLSAEIGDDVLGDDVSVKRLENKAAKLFGREAALFCTSGTMTNQIAISTHCIPGEEVICEKTSHVHLYEGGGIAKNALCSVKTISGKYGLINKELLQNNIRLKEDIHQPRQKLVCIENTTNKGGGMYYKKSDLIDIKKLCSTHQLKLHLDGARLFNAITESNLSTLFFGEIFDSISICLSKGLGCPIGSLLIGDKNYIDDARRKRKVMGGGWRQAGYLAEAGIYALNNNIDKLKKDHTHAKRIGNALEKTIFFESILPIKTNIVIAKLKDCYKAKDIVNKFKNNQILCLDFGDNQIRFVTHLGISEKDLEKFESKIKRL